MSTTIVKMQVLVRKFVVLLFTWTYAGSLDYYTLQPIARVEEHQHNGPLVRELLTDFRERKEYELHFVQRAVRI
jgi:hypothetical protein